MENKLPHVLAEFKKGKLPEDGIGELKTLAANLVKQYAS
jgi:F-type H+-transporting ATPase subunit alpha